MIRRQLTSLGLLALTAFPMGWALVSAAAAAGDTTAWQDLWLQTQLFPAVAMTVWTGLTATAVSVGMTAWLLSATFPGPGWRRLVRFLGPMLAVPHVAFAVGLMALIAPSGWLARLLSPWLTGALAPPAWLTTQDPWGLGLITVLVFKEVPFLLWSAAAQLQRLDISQNLGRELVIARSLGYQPKRAWWRIVWPQLWPRMSWPVLAVLAYSLTVVDVAMLIGPNSPPTLPVLTWTWLQDSQTSQNTIGAAAAWLLAGLLLASVAVAGLVDRMGFWRIRWSDGNRGHPHGTDKTPIPKAVSLARGQLPDGGGSLLALLIGLYVLVMAALGIGSISGVWSFPALWPQTLTGGAWLSVADSFHTVAVTLSLGLASSLTALLWAVAWLEMAPAAWDAVLRRFIYLPLVLPSVLWVVGIHALCLTWGLDGHWSGLWLAHSLAALPYVVIALSPAFLGFDIRYRHVCASMGKTHFLFLWRVKWPLLRAALASAAAVGFAVSVAQYLPTLYVGAGRYATVTTEAVNLAAGAQRSLTSAYALLQWLLPVIGFTLAAWVGQARRFAPDGSRHFFPT